MIAEATDTLEMEVGAESHVPPTLLLWSHLYLHGNVIGIQSPNTERAKRSDLRGFDEWYGDLNDHLLIEEWQARDTRAYLRHLERRELAPTTINRAFRTLRHFARWVHEQPETPFGRLGLPTAGIKELAIEEPPPKKLSPREVMALFKAADRLVKTETRTNSRPLRNRAMLAVLYYTGLRVTELVRLKLSQWDGKAFQRVIRKGNVRTKRLYLHRDGRPLLQAYLDEERPRDDDDGGWMFLPSKNTGPITTRNVRLMLVRLADEATKHGGELHLHPHRLRHTFGFAVREKTHSDSETARLLGHQSDKYAGRYARSTDAEREALIDSIEVG